MFWLPDLISQDKAPRLYGGRHGRYEEVLGYDRGPPGGEADDDDAAVGAEGADPWAVAREDLTDWLVGRVWADFVDEVRPAADTRTWAWGGVAPLWNHVCGS
jgi:hypothetical protein